MRETSRKNRFITILLCMILAMVGAIIMPRFDSDRSSQMIFLTIFLFVYFLRERFLVKSGKEKIGDISRIILVARPLVTLLAGVISILLELRQVAETGESMPIPIYYFLIGTVAGLGYLYVLYDEKVHEEKEL